MTGSVALVWFKRDLRLQDHAALLAAQTFEATAAVFVIEPEWLSSPECSADHVQFTLTCLQELRLALGARGLPLLVRVGSMLPMLDDLHRTLAFTHLLSHEETGSGWTYARDLKVAHWCASHAVHWQEFSQTGVVRRLRSRNGWAARWSQRMNEPLAPAGKKFNGGFAGHQAGSGASLHDVPALASLGLPAPLQSTQAAGEAAACAELAHFLAGRGRDYRRSISSPLLAQEACSRLSPHLAFGTLSMRAVHQATEATIARTPDRTLAHALRGFAGRLRWHCHFMQKLEDEPAIEFENFARVCNGLREAQFDNTRFNAWCQAQTGYPMVDACMRSLQATGWLNFRMRAMLVSFASYHLWLHWRQTGLFLARQFLDFEPGIHWSQMQMQSGTTGINTLRVYSPTKQALDHDAQGIFIRQWLPELARVPLPLLARPWLMSDAEQTEAGCILGHHYPWPVVDEKEAAKYAKDRLYGLRKTSNARQQANAVQERHGSRKSGLPNTAIRKKSVLPQRAKKAADKAAAVVAMAALQGSLF